MPEGLLRAVSGVGLVVIVGKLVGLARDMTMASRFGAEDVAAAFFACVAWQALTVTVVAEAVAAEQSRAEAMGNRGGVRTIWGAAIAVFGF